MAFYHGSFERPTRSVRRFAGRCSKAQSLRFNCLLRLWIVGCYCFLFDGQRIHRIQRGARFVFVFYYLLFVINIIT